LPYGFTPPLQSLQGGVSVSGQGGTGGGEAVEE
jgi:hypothetical protein